MNAGESSSNFAETRWTLVLRSQGESTEARNALSDLCGAYYEPVIAFIRRAGWDADSARDLAHEFFERLLERRNLHADPGRGRFRSYLAGAVKHFLADRHDRGSAQKRGGGIALVSLDAAVTDTGAALPIADHTSPDPQREFDRRWALTVLDRALSKVAADFAANGKHHLFHFLKPWLTGDSQSLSHAESGLVLGISEGAAKVAVHRLRQKFRDAVKTEISQTVHREDEVQEELEYLLSVV